MVRCTRLVVAGALTAFVAAGCGAGKPLSVVAHPTVRSIQLPRARLHQLLGHGALRLSPSQLAFMTTGSVSCAWWPKRLTVVDRSTIQIDMRVNGSVSRCGAGATGFPIAVKINPRIIDAHRSLSVRLDYEVGANRWSRTVVAPPLGPLRL
jgi:hypothetical protein